MFRPNRCLPSFSSDPHAQYSLARRLGDGRGCTFSGHLRPTTARLDILENTADN